ncbi:hypothetical protein BOTCAL_0370g00090 [Botryotinia calthae]|uniref:Uncharacterized protein n=1 Tax=Botryotinia calthae TaxID=38488 RepID=A0A4Y8CSL1_9HELO|nr:hypothetical protein BOTCAL_0370g00090 [Botryotinia calthae]
MQFQSFCFASAALAIAIMAAPIIESNSLAAREASVPRGFFNNNDAGSDVKRGFFNNGDALVAAKEKRGFFNNEASDSSKTKRGFFNNDNSVDASKRHEAKEERGFFNNGDSVAEVSKRDEEIDDGYYYTYTDSNK